MHNQESVGITHLAYKLPKNKFSVEELEKRGQLKSKSEILSDFGFRYCYEHNYQSDFVDLIIENGKDLLNQEGVNKEAISNIFLYSGLNQKSPSENVLDLFKYPVFQAHYELGLTNANAVTISEQGCSGLLSSIQIANSLLKTTNQQSIMCLAGDMLPPHSNREIMYNIMSDATAGILIEKGANKNKIIHYYQQTQSYYWNTPEREQELLAAYFPMAQRTIMRSLQEAGLSLHDISWFIPHNVSLRSWKILAGLLAVPESKIWNHNISRIGHTVSCDHIINLVDMEKAGLIKKGDFLVLFTFGFGASWSCLIIQH